MRCSDSVVNCSAPRFTFSVSPTGDICQGKTGDAKALPAFADENHVECSGNVGGGR